MTTAIKHIKTINSLTLFWAVFFTALLMRQSPSYELVRGFSDEVGMFECSVEDLELEVEDGGIRRHLKYVLSKKENIENRPYV